MQPKQPKYCGAKTRNGGTCHGKPMANGRCRMHGGKSRGGISSPALKHGRYSKHLPPNIYERYSEALADEDLLNQRDEIALIETRIASLLDRLEHGDLGARWLELQTNYETILAATQKQDLGAGQAAFEKIGKLIEIGADDYNVWKQVNEALEIRRKLVDTERKRLTDMQQMITAEQGVLLIGALLSILKEEVQEDYVLSRLQTRIAGLLASRTSEGIIS